MLSDTYKHHIIQTLVDGPADTTMRLNTKKELGTGYIHEPSTSIPPSTLVNSNMSNWFKPPTGKEV